MEQLTRREILVVLKAQGLRSFRRIAKACRSFERYQRTSILMRESRKLTDEGKKRAREYRDVASHLGIGTYGFADEMSVCVSCQGRGRI